MLFYMTRFEEPGAGPVNMTGRGGSPMVGNTRICWYFFFQAEDGIRDLTVTGVQTCALPISPFELTRSGSANALPMLCLTRVGFLGEAIWEEARGTAGYLSPRQGHHKGPPSRSDRKSVV